FLRKGLAPSGRDGRNPPEGSPQENVTPYSLGAVTVSLSPITSVAAEIIATAMFAVQTKGTGFIEITRQAADFIAEAGGKNGALLVFTRHTSASLVIQENADPDVQLDMVTALDPLAPANAKWVH